MSKALIAILMLCIIGGSTAFQVDAEKCFTQAAAFTHEVKGLISSVKTSPLQVAKLLGSAYDTFQTVNPLIQGCGFDFPLLDQAENYKPANATQCFNDIEKLANIAFDIKATSDTKDLSSAGGIFDILPKISEAFKIYNQAKKNCEVAPKTNLLSSNGFDINIFKCIQEAQTTLTDAKKFIADSKAEVLPMEDIFEEGINVYNEIVVLLRDCGAQKIALPVVDRVSELKTCVKDIKNTVSAIEQTFSALKNRKFTELFTDAKNVYAAIISDVADCPKKNLLSSADIFACIADGVSISKDLKKFVDSAKSKNTKDIVIGAYTVLGQLGPLAKDCDLNLNIDIPQFNPADLQNCAANTDSLVNTVEQLAKDVSGKKLWNIVSDVTSAVSQLKAIINYCKNTKSMLSLNADPISCITHAKKLYEEVVVLIDNSKTKNVPEIVFGAYTIVESLQPLVNQCGLKADLHIPTITFPDLKGCVVDTQTLIGNFQQIRNDYKEKNYLKIFDDAAEVVKTLQNIATLCKPNKALEAGIDILTCINDGKNLYQNVDKLIADSKNKAPINEIVVLAYSTIQSLQPLVDACGLKVDLHIPAITFPDLNGCVVDASGLVDIIKAIRDDVKGKNISNVFDHVASAVITLQSIASECKPIKTLQSGTNILECIQDAKHLYENVDKLIADSKNKAPVNEIVVLAYNTIESLQPLVDACGLKVDLHIPTITFPDLNGCVIDASGLVDTIKAIRDDIKEKNISNIFDHVAASVITLQSIAEKCKPQKALLSFNILKCFQTGQKVYSDVKNFVDINKESKPLNEVVVAAFTIIKELQPLLNDCDLKVDLHIPDIDFNDLNGCIVDSTSIVNDFKTLAQQLKDKNYISIIGTIQSAIAHVKAVSDECKVNKNSPKFALQANILTCAKESQSMFKRASALVSEFKSKQIPDVVVTAYDIVQNLQTLVDACVPKQVDLHIPKITFVNLKQCVIDVQSVITIVNTIKNDVKVKNWNKIIGDAKEIVASFQSIKSHCSAKKALSVDPSQIVTCFNNAKKVYEDVKTFVDINKEKRPINELIVHAFGVIQELQPFLTSCGVKADLHIPQIEFNDLNGCIVDGQKVVDSFKALLADLKAKDFIKILVDAKTIVEVGKNVATECKAQKIPALQASLNLHCVKSLGKVAKDAYSVYKKLNESSDVLDKILTIQGFLTDLQPACDDCGIKAHIPTIPTEGKIVATVECVADVAKAVESIGALYTHASSLNLVGAYSDIKDLISSATDANQKCRQISQQVVM